jgi:hypothetical protein
MLLLKEEQKKGTRRRSEPRDMALWLLVFWQASYIFVAWIDLVTCIYI